MQRRSSEGHERQLERRRREDSAPRLADEVPNLDTLRLTVSHCRESGSVESEHVRIVIVPRAPALFVLPCGDKECKDGGHDITYEVLSALRQGRRAFEGTHACDGSVGSAAARCNCSIKYTAEATYK